MSSILNANFSPENKYITNDRAVSVRYRTCKCRKTITAGPYLKGKTENKLSKSIVLKIITKICWCETDRFTHDQRHVHVDISTLPFTVSFNTLFRNLHYKNRH